MTDEIPAPIDEHAVTDDGEPAQVIVNWAPVYGKATRYRFVPLENGDWSRRHEVETQTGGWRQVGSERVKQLELRTEALDAE